MAKTTTKTTAPALITEVPTVKPYGGKAINPDHAALMRELAKHDKSEGIYINDLAEALGCSVGQVRSRIDGARKMFIQGTSVIVQGPKPLHFSWHGYPAPKK
jgi:hypothetical protein